MALDMNAIQKQKLERRGSRRASLFAPELVKPALRQAFIMLLPWKLFSNPVMFITEVGAAITTLVTVQTFIYGGPHFWYQFWVGVILWATVLFANFAESLAEARGKAQADSLRHARRDTPARRMVNGRTETVSSTQLHLGDKVKVAAGEMIPADGEVVEGIASVDESAITGESAPVIREANSDRSGVTGGTRVLSDEITVLVTAAPGQSFLDRMIALVEGAKRQKTPNEIALTIVLAVFTLAFLLVTATLLPIGYYFNIKLDVPTLVALLVCLIPTTIGGLLAAIGLAGMDRALGANILAKSGKAVEVAGDVDTLLVDKTGTITLGNRRAVEFLPAEGVSHEELTQIAVLASYGDETPEGRSIVELGRTMLGARVPPEPRNATVVSFSAKNRMSGLDLSDGRTLRKGASDTMRAFVTERKGIFSDQMDKLVEQVARIGGTPIVVVENARPLGVVALQDVLKPGIQDRFARLRNMGLRVVMVTGDNPITAEFIAKQAGVDDFVAEARPEDKLDYIRKEQAKGRLVAMMGDGTNDSPALAQADVGVAMNAGTQAAKEAGNMVDLDSDPTKLIEVVEIGKQLLMTRGALTTFSVANDVAKYFAIIPAMFMIAMPQLSHLNIMGLKTPQSAILSAIIFNAIIILLLIPRAIKGVKYRPVGADALLKHNLFIYGLGGIIAPFIGIKLIDLLLSGLNLV
jgi:potassium-transporting ATPase ATP-binding subunit